MLLGRDAVSGVGSLDSDFSELSIRGATGFSLLACSFTLTPSDPADLTEGNPGSLWVLTKAICCPSVRECLAVSHPQLWAEVIGMFPASCSALSRQLQQEGPAVTESTWLQASIW